LQIAITLLAVRYQNATPLNFGLIKKVASLDCSKGEFEKAIAHLTETKFLEIQQLPSEVKVVAQDASSVLASCTSEGEREGEQSRAEREPIHGATKRNGVQEVFDHWKAIHQHPRAALDDKRRGLIADRLKTYSVADLCQSISGYLNSPHHMGQNDKATKYDDLELLLRDAQHIDRGMKFYAEPPRTDLSEKSRRIISQTEGWTPPELRSVAN
jgi:hypothetical protein